MCCHAVLLEYVVHGLELEVGGAWFLTVTVLISVSLCLVCAPSMFFPKELCVMFISLISKLNKSFPPQFDMILGKLENDGSRKVG